MNRYLILTAAATMVLLSVCPAIGQQTDRENRGILSPEERAKLRERWTTMSEQERQAFRDQMRERVGTPRPAIGQQDRMGMTERFEEQITQMKTEHDEFIGELKAIRELAVKEKAKNTVERLDKLIEKNQKKFDENMAQLEQRRKRLERTLRQRPGAEAVQEQQARAATPFTISTFDEKKVSLSDYNGKIVVLEWLNFECPFSLYHHKTVKTMTNLAEKYKDKNVVWLAINSTSHTTPQANKEFAEQQKLPYPILDDRSGRVGRAYGAKTTPHIYVINQRGSIVYEGAIDNAPLGKPAGGQELINYVDKALEELTTGRRVTTAKTEPYGCSVKYP